MRNYIRSDLIMILRMESVDLIRNGIENGRRNLSVRMVDSVSNRTVKLRLNPTRYLEFCRKSLELAPEDTQIAQYLRSEIRRLAEK